MSCLEKRINVGKSNVPTSSVDTESKLKMWKNALGENIPLKDCDDKNFLTAEHTRIGKLKIPTEIERISENILLENIQDLKKIQSNSFIGMNTRMYKKYF
jgi:hypothetical protein